MITYIERGAFEKVKMRSLNLTKNYLIEIPRGIFNDIWVDWFDLSDNKIREIEPQAFNNSVFWVIIYLNNNHLQVIKSKTFYNLKVGVIDLKNNTISFLEEDSFVNIPYTSEIDLSNNKLTELRKYRIRKSIALQRVLLDRNPIKKSIEVQDFWDEIPQLRRLYKNETNVFPERKYK